MELPLKPDVPSFNPSKNFGGASPVPPFFCVIFGIDER
jgi:hypothetical protein